MKRIRKLMSVITAAFAVMIGVCAANSLGVSADALGDPCVFDAVQVEQVKKAPDWAASGEASGQVFLNFAVEESDWTDATALRIRLQSLNNGNFLPNNSGGNNIAVAIGAKSTRTDNTVWQINTPYSDVKYVYPTGEAGPNLYFINTNIPYFVVPREYTGCVELQLNETTWKEESGTIGRSIRAIAGETGQSAIDMSQVRYVSIKFEPLNYEGIVMNFGNIEINVNGNWKTVVDVSKTQLVTKPQEKTWSEAIAALTANQAMMDPVYTDSLNVNTSAFEIRKMPATPCAEHIDLGSNGVCDRCFELLPHVAWDSDEDGFCDDCNKPCCAEGMHVDQDRDGFCDICDHLLEKKDPAEENPTAEGNTSENGDEKKDKGCGGTVLVSIGATVTAIAFSAYVSLKRKN